MALFAKKDHTKTSSLGDYIRTKTAIKIELELRAKKKKRNFPLIFLLIILIPVIAMSIYYLFNSWGSMQSSAEKVWGIPKVEDKDFENAENFIRNIFEKLKNKEIDSVASEFKAGMPKLWVERGDFLFCGLSEYEATVSNVRINETKKGKEPAFILDCETAIGKLVVHLIKEEGAFKILKVDPDIPDMPLETIDARIAECKAPPPEKPKTLQPSETAQPRESGQPVVPSPDNINQPDG